MRRHPLRLAEDFDHAEGVDTGATKMTVVQQFCQRVLVDDLAARSIDEIGALSHVRQALARK